LGVVWFFFVVGGGGLRSGGEAGSEYAKKRPNNGKKPSDVSGKRRNVTEQAGVCRKKSIQRKRLV